MQSSRATQYNGNGLILMVNELGDMNGTEGNILMRIRRIDVD